MQNLRSPLKLILLISVSACGGGGGDGGSGGGDVDSGEVLFSQMTTVPSDVRMISYPDFYQTPPSGDVTVVDPYCSLTWDIVTYPTSYLGEFPMPPVQGAPLLASIRRGVAVKDYWDYGLTNPSTNEGCTGDLHTAFIATLERLVRLGADHVIIFRDTELVDINAPTLQFRPWASWAISDSELSWIVAQANTFGLKVHEYRQVTNIDSNGVMLSNTPTLAWMTKYLDAYIPYIVDRAQVAEQNGVEAFELDWGVYWWGDWTPERVALFNSKMTEAAQQVRGVYSGIILSGQIASWTYDQMLLNNIDWFIGDLFSNINVDSTENANLSVTMLKAKYLDRMSNLANAHGPSKKPVVWQVFAQSHRDYLLIHWIEDGFCVNNCMQNSLQTDFSVQAIQYEAMLEAIAEQTHFVTASVDAKSYWFVDVILPRDSFPNISQSPRNKPAESILYEWFK